MCMLCILWSASQVGYNPQKTPQRIAIPPKYSDIVKIAIHEIFHALGRAHEHQRPDRDSYLNVFLKNIHEGQQLKITWGFLEIAVFVLHVLAIIWSFCYHFGET